MKRILIILAAMLVSAAGHAQSGAAAHKANYERQVKAVGPAGIGVETILDRWEAEFPDDPDMLHARFSWCYLKGQSSSVVPKAQDRFMGGKPLLSLPDSTAPGGKKNYFEEISFDPDLFMRATKYITRAIGLRPDELRFRFDKISAMIAYEKESPDLATEDIRALVDYHVTQKPAWTCDGKPVDEDFFKAAMQEYCYTFFRIGSPASFDSFHELSVKMHGYWPKDPVFLDDIGSWWLIAKKNPKTALATYKKVLKLDASDYTALKNIIIIARNAKDVKLEKKYLPRLIKVTGNETEKAALQARLDYFNAK
ncbi:MAG: hypothetical protein IJ799_08150 [Bacteroidales bacterium]|nr:hypothetical protein [Bacteroidales bacterium]